MPICLVMRVSPDLLVEGRWCGTCKNRETGSQNQDTLYEKNIAISVKKRK